jgi:serine/threonine protein kinase
LRDLLKKMLKKDPRKRISLADVMCHDWVTVEGSEPLSIASGPISFFQPTTPALERHVPSGSPDDGQLVLADFDSVVDFGTDRARRPRDPRRSSNGVSTRGLRYVDDGEKIVSSSGAATSSKPARDWDTTQSEARHVLLARVRSRVAAVSALRSMFD